MKEIVLKPNAKIDRKEFHVNFKADGSGGKRRIKGFASTKFPDRVGDIVLPDALKASMDIYLQNPIVLLNHNRDQAIGKMVDYQITPDGLYVTDEIAQGVQAADEAWSLIEQGVLRGLSIGFIPKQVNYNGDHPVIEELELIEHSVVSIPANRESLFSIAKAFVDGTDLIDKAQRLMGFAKTLADFEAVSRIIVQNFKGLSESDKLRIDVIMKSLQTGLENIGDLDQLEIDNLELEVELMKLISR